MELKDLDQDRLKESVQRIKNQENSEPSSAPSQPSPENSQQLQSQSKGPQELSSLSQPATPPESKPSSPPEPSAPATAPKTQPEKPTQQSQSIKDKVEGKPPQPAPEKPKEDQPAPSAGERFKDVLNKAQNEGQSIDMEQDADSFDLDTIDVLLTRLNKEDLKDPQKVEDLIYTLIGQEIIKLKDKQENEYGRYFLEYVQNQIDEGKYKISRELANDFSPQAKRKKDSNPVLWLINQKRKELVEKKKKAQGKTQNAYYNKAIDQIEILGRTLILDEK